MGFQSLGIAERLIPAHLSMLDEKECFGSGWHGFALGYSSGNPSENLAQLRRVLHSLLRKVLQLSSYVVIKASPFVSNTNLELSI